MMLIAQIKKTYWNWFILSAFISFLICLPLISIFIFDNPSDNEIWEHLKSTVLSDYFLNTVNLSVTTLILSIIFGYLPAYFLSFYKFKYSFLLDVVFALPLTIPSYVMAYTYGNIFSFTGDFYQVFNYVLGESFREEYYYNFLNFFNLSLILSFSFFPYIFLAVRTYFESINKSIINAARSLGKSQTNIFWKILLPISIPAISTGGLLVLMEVLNEYGAVKYFGYSTLTIGIFRAWQGMGSIESASNIASYFTGIVILILLFNYLIVRKKRYSLNSSNNFNKLNPSFSNKFFLLLLFFLIALPSFFIPFGFISKNFINNIDRIKDLLDVIINTLVVGIISSVIVLLFSNILIFNSRINSGTISKLFIGVSKFAYSVPGAVLAVGFLTLFLLVFKIGTIGLIFLILALSVRFIAPAFSQIENTDKTNSILPIKSAQVLGKSSINIFRKLHLQDTLIFNLFAFVIVLVDVAKELPLTLILRPFNFDTLATKTYDYAGDELLNISSVPSFLIIILGIISFIFIRNYSFGNIKNK